MKNRFYIIIVIVFALFTVSRTFINIYLNRDSQKQTFSHHKKYSVNGTNIDSLCLSILRWDIYGPFTIQEDSLYGKILTKGNSPSSLINNREQTKYIKDYLPPYNQVDLNEVFYSSLENKKLLQDSSSYLICDLHSEDNWDVFIEIKCSMRHEVFVKGDTIKRKDIQGLNFYPIRLQKGPNKIVVKVLGLNEDGSFEAKICNKNNMLRLYAEGQSSNIIYPLIYDSKIVMFTNGHARLDSCRVVMSMHDTKGQLLRNFTLHPDSFTYYIPEIEVGNSYMCSMTMGKTTVRQPVLCGDADKAYEKFDSLRKCLPEEHPRKREVDEVLYRYNFLLHHPSRYEGDWWWQFKISPLTYQLEYIFAHLDRKPGDCIGEPNVQLMTYRSPLDNSVGRYLLVTPNNYTTDKALPLVVAVRPHVINHHHFFTSPQMARQWATNLVQALANRYNYIVMMPEARMYHDEDLTPFAEAELMYAIDHVKQHYPIDTTRIFLHGNCSGGNRALSMAVRYPDYFAAIALYAPSYKIERHNEWSESHAPHNNINKLRHMPIMVHGDPTDTHSPLSLYKELIDDARKYKLPLHLSMKRNSGQFYNVVLVGEEAFDFFKDKSKKHSSPRNRREKTISSPMVIADFFNRPFVYVYNAADTTTMYRTTVDSIRNEYEKYLFARLPLVPDTLITKDAIAEKNMFLIGTKFKNDQINQLITEIPIPIINDSSSMSLSIHQHPRNKKGHILLYTTNGNTFLEHRIHHPWYKGLNNNIIIR